MFDVIEWCSWSWSSQERSWTQVNIEPPSWWHQPQGFLGNGHCKVSAPPSECRWWIDKTGEPQKNAEGDQKQRGNQWAEVINEMRVKCLKSDKKTTIFSSICFLLAKPSPLLMCYNVKTQQTICLRFYETCSTFISQLLLENSEFVSVYLACMPVWAQASLVNSMQRPSFTSHKHISLLPGQRVKHVKLRVIQYNSLCLKVFV